jgi:nucleotide-binding universal stress UspA family protein
MGVGTIPVAVGPTDHERIGGTVGDPKERMVELAENTGADVVGGGQERSPAGKALFGSVAQSIMLEASRPGRYVRTGTA